MVWGCRESEKVIFFVHRDLREPIAVSEVQTLLLKVVRYVYCVFFALYLTIVRLIHIAFSSSLVDNVLCAKIKGEKSEFFFEK